MKNEIILKNYMNIIIIGQSGDNLGSDSWEKKMLKTQHPMQTSLLLIVPCYI